MSVRAGGVDWERRWTEMVEAAASPRAVGEDPWRGRASHFERMGRERADVALPRLAEGILPTDLVADIGAGAGRHAVPIAKLCARVIAVEPSSSMREHLMARIGEERAAVSVTSDPWPCPIETVDVIYSCHVLYGVADAGAFIRAMTASARRACKLLLGLRPPAERLAPLWLAVHGFERPPRPAALEALALLHQLGIPASLRVVPGSDRPMRFEDTEDDIDELCRRLHLEPSEAGQEKVRAALDALAPRAAPKAPWTLGPTGPHALIEWPGEWNLVRGTR